MENISETCSALLPILGVVALIGVVILLYELIKIIRKVNITIDKANVTIDMVDTTIEKVQNPLDTVVKISTTVDKAHDATIKACKDAKEFVDRNAVIIKEKVNDLMSKKQEDIKEPSPEDIIGGE